MKSQTVGSILCASLLFGCSEYDVNDKEPTDETYVESNDETHQELPPEETAPEPDIVVNPQLINYGIVYAGTSVDDTFQVGNVSDGTLTVSQVEITTGYDLGYSLTLPEPLPWQLEVGEYKEVVVTFEAHGSNSVYGGVTIASNDPDEPISTVTLTSDTYEPPEETLEGCVGVADIVLDEELMVWSWDSGPDIGTVEVDFGGTYHVYSDYIAESGSSQTNESAYMRFSNSQNPDGFPLMNNCNDDWVVADLDNNGSVPAGMVAYVGTFYLMPGENTISMHHYCPVYRAGDCPNFHFPADANSTCDSGNPNSVHFTGTAICLLPAL